jgi:hypothetical protein
MISIRILLLAFLSTLISNVTAQRKLIRFLGADTSYTFIKGVQPQNKLIALPQELNCETGKHHYMVSKGQLFVQVDGSGKLFKVDSTNLSPFRLDKTCYEGYNFSAYNIYWKGRFYSISGWGFWRYDGGIRCFDETSKEWSIIPTNKRVPIAHLFNSIGWLDNNDEKFYVVYGKDEDSYIKNHEKHYDSIFVQCLDLNTMNWWNEPKRILLKNPLVTINSNRKIIPTHMGLLIEALNKFQLYDFKNNKAYTLSDDKAAAIAALTTRHSDGFFIQRNDGCYLYDTQKDSIIQLPINKNAFLKQTETIYDNSPKITINDRKTIIVGFTITLLIAMVLGLLYTNRKLRIKISSKNLTTSPNQTLSFNRSLSFEENLTLQELAVFELLVDNSIQNKLTSIDEINRALGTKNKDVSVQKNIRSEVLQSLNERFQIFSATSDSLVERERAEFDKRIYLYKINSAYLFKFKTKRNNND